MVARQRRFVKVDCYSNFSRGKLDVELVVTGTRTEGARKFVLLRDDHTADPVGHFSEESRIDAER